MARTQLIGFRRAFLLLMLLVVLPSAGLSGFGVVAIINERAAVEKRLEAVWVARMDTLTSRLAAALAAVTAREDPAGLSVSSARGELLSAAPFRVRRDIASTSDPALSDALVASPAALMALPEDELVVFSLDAGRGIFLLAARRSGDEVAGARLSEEKVAALMPSLAEDVVPEAELVRFELRPMKRDGAEGLVGRLVTEVVQARESALDAALAGRVLPQPLEDYRLVAVAMGEDPVARASTRNRVLYTVLLIIFYLTLALGVAFTARALYREAQLSRMKTDFVSLVSHELRTPLTSIRMFIETLALGRVKDPAEAREVLTLLSKETERLSELIERVLDWSRIETGRRQYARAEVGVPEVVQAAIGAFRAQTLGAPVDLETALPEDLPRIRGDRDALAGALLNLLQNAFKYTGAEKRIAVRAAVRGRREVTIDVEDNGIGISPRDRKRIFERFYRVDNLLTRRTQGSGLGLAIARRIIDAHGGRLSVRSDPGKGSCFTVHLPVSRNSERRT